jgi:ABC-type Zn uptake system ZnuABC Zn-binding protein ZnuA
MSIFNRTSDTIKSEIRALKEELVILEQELKERLEAEERNDEISKHDDEQYLRRHE